MEQTSLKCWLMTSRYESPLFVLFFAPFLIQLMNEFQPDEVCHGIDFCTDPTSHLSPNSFQKPRTTTGPRSRQTRSSKPTGNAWDWILEILERVAKHKPDRDLDDDRFSIGPVLRGSNWRARDCNDLNEDVYPGRKSV